MKKHKIVPRGARAKFCAAATEIKNHLSTLVMFWRWSPQFRIAMATMALCAVAFLRFVIAPIDRIVQRHDHLARVVAETEREARAVSGMTGFIELKDEDAGKVFVKIWRWDLPEVPVVVYPVRAPHMAPGSAVTVVADREPITPPEYLAETGALTPGDFLSVRSSPFYYATPPRYAATHSESDERLPRRRLLAPLLDAEEN